MLDVTWFAYPEEIVWWQMVLYYVGVAFGGFIIGCFGVGGGAVFMPLLLLLPGVTPAVAAGTVFCGSVPLITARCLQLVYFGRLHLRKAVPLMIGALVGAMLGQVALPYLPTAVVAFMAASTAIFAGVQTHRKVMQEARAKQQSKPSQGQDNQAPPQVLGQPDLEVRSVTPSPHTWSKREYIFSMDLEPDTARMRVLKAAFNSCVGMVASFLSSISGTGGPLILFPLWLFLDPAANMRTMVAMASPFAEVLVVFSSLGALLFGQVDVGIATIHAAVGIISVIIGGSLGEKMGDSKLKQGVGCVMVVVGIAIGVRTLVSMLA